MNVRKKRRQAFSLMESIIAFSLAFLLLGILFSFQFYLKKEELRLATVKKEILHRQEIHTTLSQFFLSLHSLQKPFQQEGNIKSLDCVVINSQNPLADEEGRIGVSLIHKNGGIYKREKSVKKEEEGEELLWISLPGAKEAYWEFFTSGEKGWSNHLSSEEEMKMVKLVVHFNAPKPKQEFALWVKP